MRERLCPWTAQPKATAGDWSLTVWQGASSATWRPFEPQAMMAHLREGWIRMTFVGYGISTHVLLPNRPSPMSSSSGSGPTSPVGPAAPPPHRLLKLKLMHRAFLAVPGSIRAHGRLNQLQVVRRGLLPSVSGQPQSAPLVLRHDITQAHAISVEATVAAVAEHQLAFIILAATPCDGMDTVTLPCLCNQMGTCASQYRYLSAPEAIQLVQVKRHNVLRLPHLRLEERQNSKTQVNMVIVKNK